MNKNITNVSFRIDADVKNQADMVFAKLGLNMTTALNIFLRQAVREGAIPFYVRLNSDELNAETLEAIEEAERMKQDPSLGKAYSDADEMIRELLA